MWYYSAFVPVWIHFVVVVPTIIVLFSLALPWFSSFLCKHRSSPCASVWPAAMVISSSYGCLWSSAGRAEPHTSQHLVPSRLRIQYTFLSLSAVCCVLPNSFSCYCTPDVHRFSGWGRFCLCKVCSYGAWCKTLVHHQFLLTYMKICFPLSCDGESMRTLHSVSSWPLSGRMSQGSSRFRMRWINVWWSRLSVTPLNMWPQTLPADVIAYVLVATCLALRDQRPSLTFS